MVGFSDFLEFLGSAYFIILVGVIFAGKDVILSLNRAGFRLRIDLNDEAMES